MADRKQRWPALAGLFDELGGAQPEGTGRHRKPDTDAEGDAGEPSETDRN